MMFRLLTILFLLAATPALAADKAVTPLTKLDAATTKMLENLDHNATLQFATIRNSHSIIRAVEDVEKNVTAASRSCSEHNPDFADTMQKRIAEWKETIDPILADARDRLSTMIKLQNFSSVVDAKNYLKLVDAAVAYKARGIKIIPVTEKEDCEKLLDTMDDSQEDLPKLLIENLKLNRPVATTPDK